MANEIKTPDDMKHFYVESVIPKKWRRNLPTVLEITMVIHGDQVRIKNYILQPEPVNYHKRHGKAAQKPKRDE